MQTTISAIDLAKVIRANLDEFDWTMSTSAITKYLEKKTQQRVTFASLVLAMLQCQFAAAPHGTTIRFLPMKYVSTTN